jgi:DNA-binding transcriptional MerR regulator
LTGPVVTGEDHGVSVEELAAEVGLPTSTIRMYQTKGLLHAPRRVGRTARYDVSHVQRLRLVQRLQDRGFSLPAIGQLLEARDRGDSVADVLGLAPDGPEDWIPIGINEIRALVSVRELRPSLLRRATQLGLVKWRHGRPHTRRWALESGARLCQLTIGPQEVLSQYARLRESTDRVAADFVDVFERHLWPAIAETSGQADQLDQVRSLLIELTSTAESVVVGALRESIRDATEQFASKHGLLEDDPVWLQQPVPTLAERLTEPGGEEPDIEGFLAGEE